MTMPHGLVCRLRVGMLAAMLLATASSAGAQTLFAAFFTEKTMRVDYYHTGGGQEVFSLDQVVSDGPWAGSRTRLLDDTNLGPYFFEVIDRKTNQPIYSRGFASIYGEWESTDEPKQGLHRSFHESIRFPWPNGQVQVVIKKRDDDRPYQTSGVRAVKSTIAVLPGPSGLGKGYLQEFHRSPFRF